MTRRRLSSVSGVSPYALALAALVAVAVGLTLAATMDDRLPGELRAVREVQGWAFPGEWISRFVRRLTTTGLVIVLGVLLAVGLFVAGRRREALALLLLMTALPLLQSGIKDLVDRPRPMAEQVDVRGDVTSESFPSGHVMSGTTLYGFVLYLVVAIPWRLFARVAVGAACAALIVLSAPVNLWLGVHWPLDVAGGYAWGLALVLAGIWFAREGPRV